MTAVPLLLAFAAIDPNQVLLRAVARARQILNHMPNYTCVETITREYFRPLAPVERACDVLLEMRKHPTLDMRPRRISTDRLRLEVTMSRNGELRSWLGAKRFEERDIDTIVPHGPMGTGAFAGFLASIFAEDAAKCAFLRELKRDGKLRLEYAYSAPRHSSHYRIRVGDGWILTAYDGTFEADPVTADVTRIVVETALLPEAAGMCRSTTRIDLNLAPIGDGLFLLPKAATQNFLRGDGRETLNTTQFSDCREYRGESTIVYDAVPAHGGNGAAESAPPVTPEGLTFAMELLEPIDTTTAAAGDPFTARLRSPLRANRKTLAPKGAVVHGRLLRVEQWHAGIIEAIVVMRPVSIEGNGVELPVAARRDLTREIRAASRRKRGRQILLPAPWEGNSGLFRFPGERVVVPRGFVTEWRTVVAEPEE